MSTNSTKPIIAHGGPVSAALRTMQAAQECAWQSDGSDAQERRAVAYDASRALAEAFHDRGELLEVSSAAHRGPVELARRMRSTEFGGEGFPKRRSFGAYRAHPFGEDHGADGEYASAYTYALQTIRPFISDIH